MLFTEKSENALRIEWEKSLVLISILPKVRSLRSLTSRFRLVIIIVGGDGVVALFGGWVLVARERDSEQDDQKVHNQGSTHANKHAQSLEERLLKFLCDPIHPFALHLKENLGG